MKRIVCILLTAVMLLSLCACGAAVQQPAAEPETSADAPAQTDKQPGDTLTLGMLADPDTFNPLLTIDGNAGCWFAALTYPTLLTQDTGASVQPYAAESYEISEDGKAVTYHLRQDLQWSDGTPFTSADVAYTKYLAGDLGMSRLTSSVLANVEEVETPDDYTVVFHLNTPSYSFVNSIGVRLSILPKHIWENIEDPVSYLNDTDPVAMGPYKLGEYERGVYYTLEAVDNWFASPDGIPVKKLIFRVYPDENAMALALQGKEIDITARNISSAELVSQLTEAGYAMAESSSLGFVHVGFNLKNELLSDVAVRRAVAQAIDKDTCRRFAVQDAGRTMDSIISPAFTGLGSDDADAKYPAYDAEAARQTLADAGYEDTDGDGVLNAPNGENLSFNMIYISNDIASVNCIDVIKQNLADIGIALEPMPLERTTFSSTRLNGEFDSYLAGWGTMEPMLGDFIINYLSSSVVYFNGEKCDATEEAVLAMQNATSEKELVDGIHAFEKAMAQDFINVPLYIQQLDYLYNADVVENVTAYPSAMHGVCTPAAILAMSVYAK